MVNLKDIHKLRNLTQAGIMDCRKSLEKSGGDFNKAKKFLLQKGAEIAAAKANRETGAGTIGSYVHNNGEVAALVKLTCETDFVSRNEEFRQLAHELAMQVASMKPKDVRELLKQEYIRDSSKTINDLINKAVGKIKENIKIDKFIRFQI